MPSLFKIFSKFETTCALCNGKLGAKCDQGDGCEKGADQKGTLEVVDSQRFDRWFRANLVGPILWRPENSVIISSKWPILILSLGCSDSCFLDSQSISQPKINMACHCCLKYSLVKCLLEHAIRLENHCYRNPRLRCRHYFKNHSLPCLPTWKSCILPLGAEAFLGHRYTRCPLWASARPDSPWRSFHLELKSFLICLR